MTRGLGLVAVSGLLGCAHLAKANGACGETKAGTVCMGPTSGPDQEMAAFLNAERSSIAVLHSAEFASRMRDFAKGVSPEAPYAPAWANVDVDHSVAKIRRNVEGLPVTTFGGLVGLWNKVFSGTVAKDGGGCGPIRINRWALPRAHGDLVNTIVHEASHRANLTHPSSDDDFSVALCEPPYVAGAIAQQLAEGAAWKYEQGQDCEALGPKP